LHQVTACRWVQEGCLQNRGSSRTVDRQRQRRGRDGVPIHIAAIAGGDLVRSGRQIRDRKSGLAAGGRGRAQGRASIEELDLAGRESDSRWRGWSQLRGKIDSLAERGSGRSR